MPIRLQDKVEMRHTLSFMIVALYVLSLGFSDPSKSFAPSIKVKIEHTHEMVSGHRHHHDFANDAGHEDGQDAGHKHDTNSEHRHSVPHSHEVSMSMTVGCVLCSDFIIPVFAVLEQPNSLLSAYAQIPPQNISLNSIFRPPIAA